MFLTNLFKTINISISMLWHGIIFSSLSFASMIQDNIAIGIIGQASVKSNFFSLGKMAFYSIEPTSNTDLVKNKLVKNKLVKNKKAEVESIKSQIARFAIFNPKTQMAFLKPGASTGGRAFPDPNNPVDPYIESINKRQITYYNQVLSEFKKLEKESDSSGAEDELISSDIKIIQEKQLNQSLSYFGSFGIKLMKEISNEFLLDISIVAKKAFQQITLSFDDKKIELQTAENFYNNIIAEVNCGFLYHFADIYEHIKMHAGAGVSVQYNFVDVSFEQQLSFTEDKNLYTSLVPKETKFDKGHLTGAVYVSLQGMFKPTKATLAGLGLKLSTDSTGIFGNIAGIQGIEYDNNLPELKLTGMIYLTYLI